ncbi:SRSO17 transposase [Streptomyces caelestis]|uniref:SRSO17 transposase n=1 Tax=Streptomyces caelestis TaxID=36816 RepID=A0A7W9LQD7_9ACTN|nr:SRSO17 transposase [Streptomyces caelestis]
MKTNDRAVAAGHSVDPARWQEAFDGLMSRIAGRFARVEPRRRAGRLVLGLLPDLPRKNCWTIAEWAGERTSDGMQHLLGRAKWDADRVRDDVRDYVVDHLHDDQAVLVVDETGDVKKGTGTVGVQRQYTGTAGRIENAQVAVYLVYAGRRGHAAVDWELYVPRSWTADPDRCRDAGLDQDTAFATKPELAVRMITRFLDAGHHASWVTGDEVYGGNPKLRAALEKRGTGYVLAVACSHEVTTRAGKFRADALAKKVPKRAWQKLSAGAGAKGHRFYDWAAIDLADPAPGSQQLLIRRNRTTGEFAYYRCYSPRPVPLATLVRVAGSRWRVEETFQSGKGLAGLDEHQVRRYASWSRWVTLAMLAHASPPSAPTNTPATPHQMDSYRSPATKSSACSSPSSSAGPSHVTGRSLRLLLTKSLLPCWPDQRLGDDDALTVEGDGGAFVQFVANINRFAHTLAERGVVRTGQDPVDRQSVWWCAHKEKDPRLCPPRPSTLADRRSRIQSIHCCETAAERGSGSGSLTRLVSRSAAKNVTQTPVPPMGERLRASVRPAQNPSGQGKDPLGVTASDLRADGPLHPL